MSATPHSLTSPRSRLKSLAAVILSSFGVGIAFGLGYPLTALVLEQRGEPSWVVGLAGAAPSLAILVLLPLLPGMVARVRPTHAIIFGCLSAAIAYCALYLLDSTVAWIAIRFLMGAAISLPWIVGETWVNHVATDQNRARVIAFYAMAFFSGFAIGPLLIDHAGTGGLLPFAIGAMGAVIAAIPIVLARDLAPDLAHEPATGLAGGFRMAPAAMAGAFLGGFLETSHFSLLTNAAMGAGVAESTSLRFLTVLLVGGLTLQFLLGWIGDRTSRKGVLVSLGFAYIVLIALLAVSFSTPMAAMAILFLIGAVIIGFYTLGLAMLGQDVPPGQLATANAAFIMMYTSGSIVGPVIAGAAMTHAPLGGFVATTAVASLVLTALMILAGRRKAVARTLMPATIATRPAWAYRTPPDPACSGSTPTLGDGP